MQPVQKPGTDEANVCLAIEIARAQFQATLSIDIYGVGYNAGVRAVLEALEAQLRAA